MSVELCVVIPTLNERPNIKPMVKRLREVLDGVEWEAVFVDDDSSDGTPDLVRAISETDNRVRCLHRIGRRGLSSACLVGMGSTGARVLSVIDADMQHDESKLGDMLTIIRSGAADIVVGSRYMEGGSTGEWPRGRVIASKGAATLAGLLFKDTRLTDPMSGFFMITRDAMMGAVRNMSGKGFKILVDIMASSPNKLRVAEVPYTFRLRRAGETKLDTLVVWEYLVLLYDKMLGGVVPARFLIFVTVGGVGAILHLVVLGSLFKGGLASFDAAQFFAAATAMVANFSLNNIFTYRDARLKGAGFAKGLAGFTTICAVGAFVNVQVAHYLFTEGIPWWISGLLGAAIGAVWNYAVSSTIVWKKKG